MGNITWSIFSFLIKLCIYLLQTAAPYLIFTTVFQNTKFATEIYSAFYYFSDIVNNFPLHNNDSNLHIGSGNSRGLKTFLLFSISFPFFFIYFFFTMQTNNRQAKITLRDIYFQLSHKLKSCIFKLCIFFWKLYIFFIRVGQLVCLQINIICLSQCETSGSTGLRLY